MHALTARTDAFLFGPEPAARIRTTKWLLAVLLGLRIALGPYRGLAGQPAALFRPVWFLRWLDHMPSVGAIATVQVVGVVAAMAALVVRRAGVGRYAFATAWACELTLAGLRASRGKVMHNDVLLILVAAVFVFASTPSDRRVVCGWPVRTALTVVGGAYFLTGFQKVVASGPAWVLSDNLRNVMYASVLTHRAPTDQVALFIADRPWLAHVVALGTIAAELGFLAILFRPRVRPWFVGVSVALHVGVWLTHGLDYWLWIGTTAIVLVDWSSMASWTRFESKPRAPSVTSPSLAPRSSTP
jgi:hypothetical protein